MKHKKLLSLFMSLVLMTTLFTPLSSFAEDNTTIITIPSIRETPGTEVDVNVSIENNPGTLGATLTFTFDEGLILMGATNGEAFSKLQMTSSADLTSPCNFVWDGQELSEEDIKDGVILTLKFKIPDDAISGTKYNISASYNVNDIFDNYFKPISVEIAAGSIEVRDFIYGDLNSDKLTNSADIIMMRRHIAGGYTQNIKVEAADVNLDKSVNSIDTVLVRRFIAGGYGVTLPYMANGCNHVIQAFPAKEATESEEGNIAYWYCNVCGKYFSDEQGNTVISLEDITIPSNPQIEYSIQYIYKMEPQNHCIKIDTYKPSQIKVLQTPVIDKYKFLGWSDQSGKMYGTELPKGTTGDLVLKANWASDRNRAVPVGKIGDPIICEDSDNGLILFAYEIGKIENVPIYEKQNLQVVNGMISRSTMTEQKSIKNEDAKVISKSIANSTTNSMAWTLSEDWNEITAVSEEWYEQNGMDLNEAEEFCKTDNNSYNMTNSKGGSSSVVNVDNSTYRLSENQAHQVTNTNETEKYAKYEIDNIISLSSTISSGLNVGLEIPLKIGLASIGANIGTSDTYAYEIGVGYEEGIYTKDTTTGTDSWEKNIDIENSSSQTDTSEKTWNSTEGFSSSNSVSSMESISRSISELISHKYKTDSSYSIGQSNSESQEFTTSNAANDLYSSSVIYSEEEIATSELSFESTGNTTGGYRLMNVGMAHVFAVVGYDIKKAAYFTYTHSVLDDDIYKEYLDYSYDGTFNDYETSVLPFEVPVFVNDYVNSRIASSKLQVNDDGIVTEYLGAADDQIILIPSYYTVTNTITNERELRVIKGIKPGLFKNNTNLIGISLGNFINEIPESAFEGCTELKEIICPNVVRIGKNAFKGCSKLSEFSVPDEIESIGEGAFDGMTSIKSNAQKKEIARRIAGSDVKNITLNISKLEDDDFSDMSLDIGEIDTFKMFGGAKEYKGLSINSAAKNTVISGVTISDCDVVPIEVSSPDLTLERVTVHSDGFALILKADNTTLSLEGVSNLHSKSANGIISKNIDFVQLNDEIYSAIETSTNVLVCGTLNNNNEYLSEDKVKTITEDEFNNYLTSRKVTFDANGGNVATEYIMAAYNSPIGELPIASRDYFMFDGWYTEAVNGEKVTAETLMTSLVDIRLYAHWVENDVSAWTLASNLPSDAQVIDRKWTYTLTSYTTSNSSSLSGWTHYNTSSQWSDYGGWSDWLTWDPGSADYRQTQHRTTYPYYYFLCPNCGTHMHGSNQCFTWGGGCGNTYNLTWTEVWHPTPWGSANLRDWHGTGKYYTYLDGQLVFQWSTGPQSSRSEWQYRDRSLTYTYYFRKTQNLETRSYNPAGGSNISNVKEWVQYRMK